MGYWCEVLCETPGHLTPTDPERRCDRETGCIPGCRCRDIRKALRAASALARERGYRYDKTYGGQCPNCQRGRKYEVG